MVTSERIVIIGGSITGLTAALALKGKGFDVTIIERDATPDASITWANSSAWSRRGAPHVLQPHVLTARLRNALHAWYPDLVEAMLSAGIWEQRFADTVHPLAKADYHPLASDEEITVFVARRTTLELVMRRHVQDAGAGTILDGVQVTGLIVDGEAAPLTVRGVRVKDAAGEREIPADVVIDASGRTTKLCDVLRAAGAEIAEEHHSSNSVYYTRHYQLLPGKSYPGVYGLPASAFPDMTVGAFPGDNRTIVVTIGAFKDDPLLFGPLQDAALFEAVCRAVPRAAAWIDPALSRPTSGVMGWANMDFLWRTTVKDGAPQVLGFFPAGDAALRSNPKYGRGCTCGVIGSHVLAETLAATNDPSERIRRYEQALTEAFRPEWEELLAVDRSDYERFRLAAGLSAPSLRVKLGSKLQSHIMNRAMVADPNVQRALMRGFYGLTIPSEWTKNPIIWLRILGAVSLPREKARAVDANLTRPTRTQIKAWIDAGKQAA